MKKPPSLAHEPWLNAGPLRRVFAAVEAAGGEIRVNGGAVRNSLLGEPVADIDLSTTLTPERMMEVALAAGFAVHPTGLQHGTVTVVCDHHPFEVTTLRVDEETDGRWAKVAFTGDWRSDAHRRDFTMNALYCAPDGEIFDFVDGYGDVLKRKVRFVGAPSRRIKEDFLRILRFFRFHARYGRGAPDAEGLAACTRLRRGLDGLAAERIRQEFMKLIVARRALATLKIMRESRILAHALPIDPDFRSFRRMTETDKAFGLIADPLLRLAALTSEPLALRQRLRLTNDETTRLRRIESSISPSPALRDAERRRVLYHLGVRGWSDAIRVAWAKGRAGTDDPAWRELLALPQSWPPPRFPLSGRDLLDAGLAPGPAIGRILGRLEDWWIASDFVPDKQALLARVEMARG